MYIGRQSTAGESWQGIGEEDGNRVRIRAHQTGFDQFSKVSRLAVLFSLFFFLFAQTLTFTNR